MFSVVYWPNGLAATANLAQDVVRGRGWLAAVRMAQRAGAMPVRCWCVAGPITSSMPLPSSAEILRLRWLALELQRPTVGPRRIEADLAFSAADATMADAYGYPIGFR